MRSRLWLIGAQLSVLGGCFQLSPLAGEAGGTATVGSTSATSTTSASGSGVTSMGVTSMGVTSVGVTSVGITTDDPSATSEVVVTETAGGCDSVCFEIEAYDADSCDPDGIAAGPFDGSNPPDIVLSCPILGLLALHVNNGADFDPAIDLYLGDLAFPSKPRVGLFDGDLVPDIVAYDEIGGQVYVVRNDGVDFETAPFIQLGVPGVLGAAPAVISNPLPNQHHLVVSRDTMFVDLWLNNGNAESFTLRIPPIMMTGTDPRQPTVRRLNPGLLADIVVADRGAPSFSLTVQPDAGAALPPPPLVLADNGRGRAFSFVTDQFNDDNILDVAVTVPENGNVVVILDPTAPGWTGDDYHVGGWPTEITSADLNNDGFTDIIIGHEDSIDPKITVMVNDLGGRFDPIIDFPVAGAVFDVTTADFNEDGRADIAAALFTTDAYTVLWSSGN